MNNVNLKIQIVFLYKGIDKEYISSIAKGELYFSCCANWRSIALKDGKEGQGDINEGVFAKYLKKNSRKPIQHYKKLFGKDLEIKPDGEYVLLSRKSSLRIPATCFYSIDTNTILKYISKSDEKRIYEKANSTDSKEFKVDEIAINFPQEYLDDFLSDNDKEAVSIKPRRFIDNLKNEFGIFDRKVSYIDMAKEYDVFRDKLIENAYKVSFDDAKKQHLEIFFKNKKYEYQNEYRIIIPNERLKSVKKGITKQVKGLESYKLNSYVEVKEPIDMRPFDIVCNVKGLISKTGIIFEKFD